jgi:Zn-dependent protease
MGVLFLVVLLHEFGHCFAARWTGGQAEEILMTPLGGLAMAYARRNPWSQFVTVAGGPMVNVVICLLCGVGLYLTIGVLPLGPWQFGTPSLDPMFTPAWFQLSSYLFWFYSVSYWLLLFNLLPIFPLDGGQLLQSILWRPMGYYKSMLLTVNIGLVGSMLMAMIGIATFGALMGGLLLILIALMCFMNCLNMRRMLLAEGPYAFEEDEGIYAAAYEPVTTKKKTPSRWAARRAEKRATEERHEQQKIDAILAKVSAHGMNSLSWWEKRTLRRATERQRQADLKRAARAR